MCLGFKTSKHKCKGNEMAYRLTMKLSGPNKDLIDFEIRDGRGQIMNGFEVSLAHIQDMADAFQSIAARAVEIKERLNREAA